MMYYTKQPNHKVTVKFVVRLFKNDLSFLLKEQTQSIQILKGVVQKRSVMEIVNM